MPGDFFRELGISLQQMTWHCFQILNFCSVLFPLVTAGEVCMASSSINDTTKSIGSTELYGPRGRTTCLLSGPTVKPFLALSPIQN